MENNAATDRPYPFALRFIRVLFPLVERIAPSLAGRWAVRLFLSPVRQGFIPGEKDFLKRVERFDIKFEGREYQGYRLGNGPEVICVHGWAGRAAQFRYIADMLVEEGFTFIAFDAWAHGQTAGKQTNLFEFAALFERVYQKCEQPAAVIGHSLGAAVVSYSIANGFQVPALVTMGSPVVADDILDEFRRTINGSALVPKALREKSIRAFGKTFESATMEETFPHVSCPVLAIHGERDADVPVRHLDILKSIRSDIRTLRIADAGHRRILKNEEALKAIKDFIHGLPVS